MHNVKNGSGPTRRRLLAGAAAAGGIAWQAAAQPAAPIRVGVLTDMSGPFSSITGPGAVVAARLAAEEFGMEVNGRKIEILSADHQNKPDVGVAIAGEWFGKQGVDVVAELVGSAVAMAVVDVARRENRIALVSGAGTSDITGRGCGPTIFHWTWDSFGLARGTVKALMEQGGQDWFFITADYAFGHVQERDSTMELTRPGGRVKGSVRVPPNTTDYSAYLLQASASGATVLALATAGGTMTALKQAREFGIERAGMRVVPLQLTLAEAHAIGPEAVQGARTLTAFYWDRTPESRAWSQRYFARTQAMPTDMQAGVYSAVRHYLQAIKDGAGPNPTAIAAKMRATPVADAFAPSGTIRTDGRVVHDMYLVEAKKPAESTNPWDLFKVVGDLRGDQVFRRLGEGGCLLKS